MRARTPKRWDIVDVNVYRRELNLTPSVRLADMARALAKIIQSEAMWGCNTIGVGIVVVLKIDTPGELRNVRRGCELGAR